MTLALLNIPHFWELLIILGIGLLLFGRRLPEVGKNIGRSIVEFRKGLKSIETEIEEETRKPGYPEPAKPYRQPLPESGPDPRVSRSDPVAADAPASPPSAQR